jgi:uncharacterized membrane protein YsdA (DUF1294 family)
MAIERTIGLPRRLFRLETGAAGYAVGHETFRHAVQPEEFNAGNS